MDSRGVRTKLAFFRLLNIAFVAIAFAVCWQLYYSKVITISYRTKGIIAIELLFLALYVIFTKVYDAFAVSVQRRMEQAISQLLSALFADGLMYVFFCLLYAWFAPVWPMLLVLIAQSLIILVWVLLANRWYYSVVPPLRAVLLHDNSSNAWHLQREMSRDKGLEVIREMGLADWRDEGLDLLEDAEVVFICAEQSSVRDEVINYCIARKLKFFVAPSINDMFINSARDVHMFHMPLLQMHMSEPSLTYLVLKRGMDIALSLLALLLLWPFMLMIALAVKLYDGGPALYKQVRLTKDSEEFELLKFRSMRVDAEADGVARLSTGDQDDRITPIGKILRKLRLDELPQLLCILKGDMSIVGPRPERPEIAAKYEEFLPEFRLRLQAKAGLTGYAQVYGKYNSTPQEKLQMDLLYISNPSIIEDLKLILTTIRVLFIKESTEGVEEDFCLEGSTAEHRS